MAPTSFEGPFGKIIYRVKAAIDTPRFAKDYKAQRPFYLLNLLNLNEVPDIDVSADLINQTLTFSCGLGLFDFTSEADRSVQPSDTTRFHFIYFFHSAFRHFFLHTIASEIASVSFNLLPCLPLAPELRCHHEEI